MLDLAQAYLDRQHGDRWSATLVFGVALVNGDGGPYPTDLAILATIDAFDMTPVETIHLTARMLAALGDRAEFRTDPGYLTPCQ